ncbi:MAG: anaerobic carbon-monoxide dehydrogenase catalytic subunit [Chloroflexi bacterium]|nr:anaerobic carbon-monoxide dehydrogenase catalytic subunit [Chloroflexota bacterium]
MAVITRDGTELVSQHASTREMYEHTKAQNITTIFDRYEAQQPQCAFGKTGVCCQLCSHGPCRISPRAPRGICGATADTIVARNIVRLATHGLAAYSHHLETIAKTMLAAAEGKTPFTIQDEGKLRSVARALGLDTDKPTNELAKDLARTALEDLRKGADEPMTLVEALAPETRREVWSRLGILPGGAHSELRDALTKSMTSINTDPVDLLMTSLRLAIATGYAGLVSTITLQDVLLGTPSIVKSEADLGVVDSEYVNIVAHGHVPLVGTAVLHASQTEEMQALARSAGAKGIKVLGSMCTGQELMQRSAHSATGFGGQTGNWINQEYLVATGAVDLVMMDLNCSTPGLKEVADRFHTKLVCVDRMVRMAGVEDIVDYDPAEIDQQARKLIKMAVEAFLRRGRRIHIPSRRKDVVAGFSAESIAGALGGSLRPLLEAIEDGLIRGIVAVVGCTNNRNGHDTTVVPLVKELIARDILVVNAGCVSSALQIEGLATLDAADLAGPGLRAVCRMLGVPPCLNFGSCVDIGRIATVVTAIADEMGIDPSELPIAVSAPEYLEQKAVADGFFAVALGLLTHIGPTPPVTGGELVSRILTQDIEQLTGGRVLLEEDPLTAARLIAEHIESKRKA